MTQTNETAGTDMVLSPRQQKLQAVRDDLAPGAKPQAIIPRNFVEAQQMCQALAGSSLVPKAFRSATGPLDMLLVVMTGSELGLPPMAALRLFTTWDGVPRLMAEGVRAIMLMSPDIEYFEMATCDDKHATWIGKRRGRPEKSITWTMERAKRAELTSKENWRKYQESMLNARASMDLGRILAPDIIAGMRSLEEAQDGDFVETTAVERPTFVAPPEFQRSVVMDAKDVIHNGPGTMATIRQGPPPGVPAVDPPKRGPGRPPKDKPVEAAAVERPTSASPVAPKDSPPSSVSTSTLTDPGGSGPTRDTGSSSPARPDLGEPAGGSATKFIDAIETARAADVARSAEAARIADLARVDRFGQNIGAPTQPDSSSAPTPSTESGTGSSVANGSASGPADDAFGEDPEDAPPTPEKNRLADFFGELAKCLNQRDVVACGNKWRSWSKQQAMAGDTTFGRDGENSAAMSKAYAARKSELPA